MIARREILMGGACLFAAGSAVALTPRRHLSLIGDRKLDKLLPSSFAGWTEQQTNALIVPQDEDSLASKLYSQVLGRMYVKPGVGDVMLLIAYGDTQNDLLQLHRPETCYPAFGFQIVDSRATDIALPHALRIPGRAMTATSTARDEHILYWTRVGEALPQSGKEQRLAKFQAQLDGIVPDGVLVRISNNLYDPAEGLALNSAFASDMVMAMPPRYRAALVGSQVAQRLG